MDSRTSSPARDEDRPAPKFRVELPPDLAAVPEEPAVPLDLDVFERWARTGDGDPWTPGK